MIAKEETVRSLIDTADHLYACERQPSRALRKIEQALRLSPDSPDALVIKGRILFQLNKVQEAMHCYKRANSIDPKFGEAFLERARVFYAITQNHTSALREVRQAIKLAGSDVWVKVGALRLKGVILAALNRNREAILCYRAALRLKPDDQETHWSFGSMLHGMGKPAQALPHLKTSLRSLQKERNRNPAILELYISETAEALDAMGKHRDALKLIEYGLQKLRGKPRRDLQYTLKGINFWNKLLK